MLLWDFYGQIGGLRWLEARGFVDKTCQDRYVCVRMCACVRLLLSLYAICSIDFDFHFIGDINPLGK